MQTLTDLNQLDAVISACDAAATDDELRAIFASFRMDLRAEPGADPFSKLYHDEQMALYRRIAGRHYALSNEATPFDVDEATRAPFPYSTGSCQTAGDHLVTIGEFIRHLRLPRHARILEFGPGWGNLTLALAALGLQVTAVDVEERFCRLIRQRAERLGLTLEVVNADFGWVTSVTKPFDAVLFFESFHHAADHLQLLRDLHGAVKPGGRVYLGAEPILSDFPIPWGLRLDGQSLWSIRKFGWMELGFRDDYFHAALAATGWSGVRAAIASPAIWELTSRELPLFVRADDGRLGTMTGRLDGAALAFSNAAAGVAVFGPYVALGPGRYLARMILADASLVGSCRMEVCARGANERIAERPIAAAEAPDAPRLEIEFVLAEARDDIEIRLLNDVGFSGRIAGIEIVDQAVG